MYTRTIAFHIAWGALGLLLWGSVLHAEQVQHHGGMVDADGTASQCLSCHDGLISHNVSFCTVRCSVTGSHSIEKNYPPPGKEASFAPVASVKAKGIKLINSKVTCISCHNLRNPAKNHLVMDNQGSKLCLACHL
jgi:predicted CXXCH cytochrome family protein